MGMMLRRHLYAAIDTTVNEQAEAVEQTASEPIEQAEAVEHTASEPIEQAEAVEQTAKKPRTTRKAK